MEIGNPFEAPSIFVFSRAAAAGQTFVAISALK